jgi:hypothetical protein
LPLLAAEFAVHGVERDADVHPRLVTDQTAHRSANAPESVYTLRRVVALY